MDHQLVDKREEIMKLVSRQTFRDIKDLELKIRDVKDLESYKLSESSLFCRYRFWQ